MSPDNLHAVAERVDARLASSVWDVARLEQATEPEVSAAAEIAVFALNLAGKRRQAKLGGRFSRLVVRFALAACVALASVASACDQPNAGPEATQTAISQLPSDNASTASITSRPRDGPALFTDVLLVHPGSDAQPWAVLMPHREGDPILADRVGAGLGNVGDVYRIPAQPVIVGTRDGPSQFLDPLQPATLAGTDVDAANAAGTKLVQKWSQDERYLAVTRAIAGRPTVLDAAYNAAAASAAGGTHTYLNGIVLRVEPDQPVLQVIDRALLESGLPTRAEDVVYVAIRASESSLYEPGQVVNLRDVVMDKQTTDLIGPSSTIYVANAALDGARVEPTERVDLQALLQPRLQVVDQDLALQNQVATTAASPAPASGPQPTATLGGTTPVQPIIVQQSNNNASSYIGDFLIFMWLTNGGFYRGGTTIINNPGTFGGRGGSVYYSPPPAPSGSSPSTIASSQAASRSTALEAARTSVSGQSSGTGGGVAATNKAAADATSRVSAATSKSVATASAVSAASAGKSTASAPSSSSSTASRSAGSTSAGSRGSAGSSSGSSSGSRGIGGSSGSSGGFGGKGISGGSSSS